MQIFHSHLFRCHKTIISLLNEKKHRAAHILANIFAITCVVTIRKIQRQREHTMIWNETDIILIL